jgi:hypothetical protein
VGQLYGHTARRQGRVTQGSENYTFSNPCRLLKPLYFVQSVSGLGLQTARNRLSVDTSNDVA